MKPPSSDERTEPINIPLEMRTATPGSYLWVIPNGGHGPIFG